MMNNPMNHIELASVEATTENRGLLPFGWKHPIYGTLVDLSYTAYGFAPTADPDDTMWVSFDRIHGRPAPVTPLVTFAPSHYGLGAVYSVCSDCGTPDDHDVDDCPAPRRWYP